MKKQRLESLDIFSLPVNITFRGKQSIKNRCGAISTIILFLGMTILSVQRFLLFWSDEVLSISKKTHWIDLNTEKAMRADPDYAEAFFNFGVLMEGTGQPEKSIVAIS